MPAKETRKRARSPAPEARGSSTCRRWLMKSEPYKFSIDDLQSMKTSSWDGVRNYEARNNMKAMCVGDQVLFYHSMAKKETGVVGIAEVCKPAYPDTTALDKKGDYYDPKATAEKNPWAMVDVAFKAKLPRVVTIDEMKKDKKLQDMVLFKRSHLSVQPVTAEEFAHIVSLSNSQQAAQKQ